MTDLNPSPEIDCNCDKRVPAGRDERGDKERCSQCGAVYLILNGEEVWLENETDEAREAEAEAAMDRQAEYDIDEMIIEQKEREGK